MTEKPLTIEQANAVYDILIKYAGASELSREGFVYLQSNGHLSEYRFIGALGYGGKFYRDAWADGVRDAWRVDCYREDRTPARQQAIDDANAALAVLKQGDTE